MPRVKDIDINTISIKGEDIYSKKYKKKLEKTAKGKIAAIEVESGDIFIGDSAMQAAMFAREKYPEKIFYFIRIGYPALHSIKGVVLKK